MADKLDKTSRVWNKEEEVKKNLWVDDSVNVKNGTLIPFLQVAKSNLRG